MQNQWDELAPNVQGTSFSKEGKVHVLHESRTRSWCGLPADNMHLEELPNGHTVTCETCKKAVLERFYPVLQQRRKADTSSYIGKRVELAWNVQEVVRCPKCRSQRIGHRFGLNGDDGTRFDHAHNRFVPVDTEDYQVHFDTLICNDCLYWDFQSAFSKQTILTEMHCAVCEKSTEHVEVDADPFSGEIQLQCRTCQTDSDLVSITDTMYEIARIRV